MGRAVHSVLCCELAGDVTFRLAVRANTTKKYINFIIQNGCMIAHHHHHQLLVVEHQLRTQDDIVVVYRNIFTYI